MRPFALLMLAALGSVPTYGAVAQKPLLILDRQLLRTLRQPVTAGFEIMPQDEMNQERILQQVSGGGGVVWIGNPDRIPPQLWVGSFRPSVAPLSISAASAAPVALPGLTFRNAVVSSLYIKPTKELPVHNVDEEPRAELVPVLEASDRFGRTVGFAGAMMRYYAPSLVGRRFAGSDCFFFPFDHPADAMSGAGWSDLLGQLARHFESGLQLQIVRTGYASYHPAERVQVHVSLANKRDHAASVEIHFSAKGPGDETFRELSTVRRVPDGGDRTEVTTSFLAGKKPGLWTLRVEAWQDLNNAEQPGVEGDPAPVDRHDIGFVVVGHALQSKTIISAAGPEILIDGRHGFWTGTNYYPSSSWWDWLWRDFHPLEAAQDFASMRRTGYRIVRIWVDPNLDEESLRALDAAIYLASQQGIVLDICVFTQWVRDLEFERADGRRIRFEYRDPRDFNIYGISLRQIALQQEYAATLARRWKSAGNVIYDLANETYVNDPDQSQIDPDLLRRHPIPSQPGRRRDTLLFRAWASEMQAAMRAAGATQIIMPGYLFSGLDGGDNYLANRDAPIEPWHSYAPYEATVATLAYQDPACSHRPVLLEEFGHAGWNPVRHYDAMAHAALSAGAAGAMSYEWGVRWLAPELSFQSLPLRDVLHVPADRRFFAPLPDIVKDWPAKSTGIHPSPSGFTYGSIYTGTPFPAAAAIALGRLSRMGEGMERLVESQSTYVVIPSAPGSIKDAMDKTSKVIGQLNAGHVAFGILQEDCLAVPPRDAHVLILTLGLPANSPELIARIRRSGTVVLDASQPGWDLSPLIHHIGAAPSDVSLMVRDVPGGHLYALESSTPKPSVHLSIEPGKDVVLGLTDFAMVRQRGTAIDWIEGSGEVSRGESPICSIRKGRAILSSSDGEDLVVTRSIRVLAAEPTQIRFPRKISSLAIIEDGRRISIPVRELGEESTLEIDDQLVQYVVEVNF
jgi:Cellulase (glycosyl hydrolase family 5)